MTEFAQHISAYIRERDQFLDARPTLGSLRQAASDGSLGDTRIGVGLQACFPRSKVSVRRACRSLGIDEFRAIRDLSAAEWHAIEAQLS